MGLHKMKRQHLFALMLIVAISIPFATGWGQALFDPSKTVYEPSRLFPIVPENEIVGAPSDPLPKELVDKIHNRCLSRVPGRFTPDAHSYYCTCSSAATQGTVTIGDLKELQKEKNRQLGNKAFEKYVHNVMKPCMDMPVEDTEYMYCVMNRKNDWRIQLPIPYCKCVSQGVRKHFEQSGEEEMMVSWGNKKLQSSDPIDSLWNNGAFQNARKEFRKSCAGAYMNPKYFGN
jgi:hypothetical protein